MKLQKDSCWRPVDPEIRKAFLYDLAILWCPHLTKKFSRQCDCTHQIVESLHLILSDIFFAPFKIIWKAKTFLMARPSIRTGPARKQWWFSFLAKNLLTSLTTTTCAKKCKWGKIESFTRFVKQIENNSYTTRSISH